MWENKMYLNRYVSYYFCSLGPLMNEIPHDVSFVTGIKWKMSSKLPQSFSSLSWLNTLSIDFGLLLILWSRPIINNLFNFMQKSLGWLTTRWTRRRVNNCAHTRYLMWSRSRQMRDWNEYMLYCVGSEKAQKKRFFSRDYNNFSWRSRLMYKWI